MVLEISNLMIKEEEKVKVIIRNKLNTNFPEVAKILEGKNFSETVKN